MKQFALILVCVCLAVVVSAQDDTAASSVTAVNGVTLLQDTVGQYEKVEMVIDLEATYSNAYDPQDIRVDVEITSPSGETVTVAGFAYEDFTFDNQVLASTDETSWRARFTPSEVGTYTYQVMATASETTVESDEGTFTVTESDEPGFVRVDSRNPRYLAFDNGDPYFPVGLNIGWSTGNTIADYEVWLDALHANGGNFIRVWMAPWDLSIEWIDTGLGDYTNRQDRAYELDQILELAEERDIYVMLSLLNHGQFNTATNPEWDQNPYNAANSGPCDVPECFATNPDAIRFWEQRLRYIVARWGYSTHIMSWEHWNEVNWTPLAGEEILGPWIARNTELLHELDPYDHLVTHSGSPDTLETVWGPLDFAQDHFYDRDDFARTFENVLEEWSAAYPGKPFLVGEFGRGTGGGLTFDPAGDDLHIGIWAAPMVGATGTAAPWWWDNYISPNDLWDELFKGVSAFFAEEDMGAHIWTPTDAEFAERTRARVYGLQADDRALLWVINRDYSPAFMEKSYLKNLRAKAENPLDFTYPDVEGSVLVMNVPAGSYTVELWDTFTGGIIKTESLESDGTLEIALPTFNRDLAVKVKQTN